MENLKKISTILSLLIFMGVFIFAVEPDSMPGIQADSLEQKAVSDGNVKVIIKLRVPRISELTDAANHFCTTDPDKTTPWGGSQADMALLDAIAYAAQGVLLELRGNAYEVKYIYKSIPYMSLQVSAEALVILRSLPAVLGIEEDIPLKLIDPVLGDDKAKGGNPPANIDDPDPPLLDTSVNLIGASAAWSMGYTGSGRYVAIMDTGIRKTHEFFSGKTIVEACYASGSDGVGPAGDCPNGLISQTGPGSAVHYPNTYQSYDHGTHVSGIAAGNHGTLFGVAKDANIIAVKIFSKFPASSCDGSPCVRAYSSDIIAGLDYVFSIRGTYSIAAANMSLGGGQYFSACDGDVRKAVIDNLRAVGIACVIATGNSGYCGSISAPACISTSVAVGSSTDADDESGFSNWHATMQKLYAPGSLIYSATGASDTSYASWNGTSMATPHVAGAWALVKQAKPSASVTQILAVLQATGVPIVSPCATTAIPRIQVDKAIISLLTQGISVTAPNGGENWMITSINTIAWSTELSGTVSIELFRNGSIVGTIASNVPAGTMAFNWTVGQYIGGTALVGNGYRIRIASENSPSIWDKSNEDFAIINSLNVTAPNGGENWVRTTSQTIGWSTLQTGTVSIELFRNGSLVGTIASNVPAGTMAFNWTVGQYNGGTVPAGNGFRIRIRSDNTPSLWDESNEDFNILSDLYVTAPNGGEIWEKNASHTIGWSTLLTGTVSIELFRNGSIVGTIASNVPAGTMALNWTVGQYNGGTVPAGKGYRIRIVSETTANARDESNEDFIISDIGTLDKYNSPSHYKILPEAIWAAATGGGTWMSEVQVTDLSGGSIVSVYYNTAAGRRGPFVLWNNGGGALRSIKYTNILQTIDGLDSSVFTYYGTVGAVEFITQDAGHVLQATARTLNGSYSKTFPAYSLHDSNTADTSRVMSITNLTSNSTYRSTCGMFNPTANPVTVELRLRDAANSQLGTTISKTVNGYGFSAFFPFNDAGVAYPANSFDNVILEVRPVSGTGKVLCFGASANKATNDPAAHLAVQNSAAHDNGPNSKQILPEAIWASASGGGIWMSEVQIVDLTGGSIVSVFFDYGGGNRRGPFTLWTGGAAGSKVKYANILQQIGTLDGGLTYYGRVGTVEFQTQDSSHVIQVTARTLNGNYSKTFPGLNLVDAETADTGRVMLIQNYSNNSTYRSSCGFFNPTADAVTIEFTLLNGSGAQIGAQFTKTFVGYDFQAFSPFNEAGVPYPANSYDNVILRVRPTSGTGQVICFGASANNASNDPAAHLAVQGQ